MKLRIHLDIEENTIWIKYKEERDAVSNVSQLQEFVKRWQTVYGFKIETSLLTERDLEQVKTEKYQKDNFVILEIILPAKILFAMLAAERFEVPLNCAFI